MASKNTPRGIYIIKIDQIIQFQRKLLLLYKLRQRTCNPIFVEIGSHFINFYDVKPSKGRLRTPSLFPTLKPHILVNFERKFFFLFLFILRCMYLVFFKYDANKNAEIAHKVIYQWPPLFRKEGVSK